MICWRVQPRRDKKKNPQSMIKQVKQQQKNYVQSRCHLASAPVIFIICGANCISFGLKSFLDANLVGLRLVLIHCLKLVLSSPKPFLLILLCSFHPKFSAGRRWGINALYRCWAVELWVN